ncbi:polysaccharide pyruvyl transferase family protein [Phenylobacterium sp.]|uniref:polysaccharide pyruvyl transferase family protein n=1 Tax=Phenylobacterium sp. TaxID=1871053 RepID=UPI0025D59750|nr:polysaccharide pyruvyl transferase family protein [Phenylobacterium sp.]
MTRSNIAIGLLWHSANSGNLGVGALTIANMSIVREVVESLGLKPRFTIIGVRDRLEPYVSPDEAATFEVDSRAMLDPRRLWATTRAQDCILDIGGGDSFTDIYAMRRYALIWGAKAIAIAAGRPLLFSPQTIGPFSRQPHTALAAWAMRHAEAVVARDDASLEAVRVMAPNARRLLSADVAFALPFEDRSRERGGAIPRVGINVSGLLFNEAHGGNRFGLDVNYADLSRQLIESFRAEGAEVHLITHALAHLPADDDGGVADQLAAEYPWAIRVPDFRGPSEAKSYISSLDFLVSGRMHACIGAVSSGTPVVPIAYSRKFKGVFGLVGYPWMVDVAGKSTAEALAYVMDGFHRRAELAADSRQSMQKVGGLLDNYRAELRRLFERIAPR